MQFKGRLRLPDDTGAGIPVDLRLDDIFLVLVAEGETLGEWRMDDVGIQRVFSNQFLLDLEGEEMVFVADDPLGFAYEGVAEIEATTQRLTKRWRGRKKKRRADDTASVVVDADRVEADRAKERRAAAAESPVPIIEPPPAPTPEEQPAPAAPATAEWTAPQPESQPFVPPAPVPAAPEVPVFEPAPVQEPQEEIQEPMVGSPVIEPVASESEPEATVAPVQEPAVEQVTETAPVEPLSQPDPEPPIVFEEPAYEVEEIVVAAATSAFTVVEEERSEPEPDSETGEDDEGFVAVEPATPGVAAAAQVAPLPVTHGDPPQVGDLPEIGAGLDDRPPDSVVAPVGRAVEPVVEPVEQSSLRSAAAAARAAIDDEPTSVEDSGGAVGDGEAPKHLRDAKAGRRSRRSRRKKPEVSEHEHTYEKKSAVGGIIRRVCSQCGHVSFGSEDVYEDWGA